jgi:hypothetical protein
MGQVPLQSFPAQRRQAVFGLGHTTVKVFRACDILSLLQLAGMHAQVAVRGFQQAIQLVETQFLVDGQSAHDAQPDSFVNEPV